MDDVFFGDFLRSFHEREFNEEKSKNGLNGTNDNNQDHDAASAYTYENQLFQVNLLPGQTLMIPGGWIHSVYTPEDSLVFGGNFLHSPAIVRQLQAYQLEQRTRVGKAYRFPHFRELNWYVLCKLLPVYGRKFERLNDSNGYKSYLKQADTGDEAEDEEDEDEDEDLLHLAVALLGQKSVFRQFPYLVRACEEWLYDGGEKTLEKITTESIAEYQEEDENRAGDKQRALFEGWKDITNSWWALLSRAAAGKNKVIDRGVIEAICSILSLSCFMWSGALDSSDLLLPYPIILLASPMTILLISTLKHQTSNMFISLYPTLQRWISQVQRLRTLVEYS